MTPVRLRTESAGATRRLGKRIGRRLRAGDIVLLSGELGAGKTVLAQGIGRGMGVADPIKSSSFVIMNEYDAAVPSVADGAQPSPAAPRPLRLYHADLFRLESPEQVAELALDEQAAGGVLVVEWPERALEELPDDHLLIRLADDGPRARTIDLEPHGPRYAELVQRLAPRTRQAPRN